jgi:hypothetical protein
VAAMIMAVYGETCFLQNINQFGITAHVLAETMRDLKDATRWASRIPSEARDRQAVTGRKMKVL